MKSVVIWLRGKKTYIALAVCGIIEILFAFGKIDAPQRDALLKLFGGAGAAAFCAKVNRAVEELRASTNIQRRRG